MKITEEKILKSLSKVEDPDLHKDLVSLGMIKNIKIEEENISFDLELTTPACPLKDKLKNDCIIALREDLPGIGGVDINFTSRPVAGVAPNGLLGKVKNTIAVASGKGGVGKSTVAVNLAAALQKQGAKVGLIDADIFGPSIPLMLGVNNNPEIYQNPATKKMIPIENYGIKLMSIGFLIDEKQAVIWRGPMASGAVKQFLSDVEWGELDYLIFDLPPGTSDIQLTLAQTIPLTGAVIVTTPQDVALTDARKAIQMFKKVNVPILGIVENMSYFIAPDTKKRYDIFGVGGGKKLSEEHEAEFLGEIPIDPRIREGGDTGKPIVIELKESENAEKIKEIAGNLTAQVSICNMNNTHKIEINL